MRMNDVFIVVLAAGRGTRFEGGDKLLSEVAGVSVLRRTASVLKTEAVAGRLAVIAGDRGARHGELAGLGFELIHNEAPERGQGHSLSLAVEHVRQKSGADAVLVLLADMPLVAEAHLIDLINAMDESVDAVISEVAGVQMPPVLFHRRCFARLVDLEGDRGARHVFSELLHTRTIAMPPECGRDIDTRRDLKLAEEMLDG